MPTTPILPVFTARQLLTAIGAMNMTTIDHPRKVPSVVDEMLQYRNDYDEPTHFIDILWNHDLRNPRCFAIIILRHDCRENVTNPIPRQSWFIDSMEMHPAFIHIAGARPAGQSVSLASLLIETNFACFDATAVATAFRACFRIGDFDHLHDVQMQVYGALDAIAPPLSEVRQKLSFVNILKLMESDGWQVTWDRFELSRGDALIRTTGGVGLFNQRPLGDEVVDRYVAGICHLVAMYKWHRARIERLRLGPDVHARIRQLSRDRAFQGYLLASSRGYRPVLDRPIVGVWQI